MSRITKRAARYQIADGRTLDTLDNETLLQVLMDTIDLVEAIQDDLDRPSGRIDRWRVSKP